jgi:hypothetical protein
VTGWIEQLDSWLAFLIESENAPVDASLVHQYEFASTELWRHGLLLRANCRGEHMLRNDSAKKSGG